MFANPYGALFIDNARRTLEIDDVVKAAMKNEGDRGCLGNRGVTILKPGSQSIFQRLKNWINHSCTWFITHFEPTGAHTPYVQTLHEVRDFSRAIGHALRASARYGNSLDGSSCNSSLKKEALKGFCEKILLDESLVGRRTLNIANPYEKFLGVEGKRVLEGPKALNEEAGADSQNILDEKRKQIIMEHSKKFTHDEGEKVLEGLKALNGEFGEKLPQIFKDSLTLFGEKFGSARVATSIDGAPSVSAPTPNPPDNTIKTAPDINNVFKDSTPSPPPLLYSMEPNIRRVEVKEDYIVDYASTYKIPHLTFAGEELVADYYNKKYFADDSMGGKIIPTKNYKDFGNKLAELINDDKCKMAGLIFKIDNFEGGHATPVVFEKRGEEIHLFISDAWSQGKKAHDKIEGICNAMGLQVHLHTSKPEFIGKSRQADEHSCHSEALYYLQRALRLGSLYEKVSFEKGEISGKSYSVYQDLPDLMLTAQTKKSLDAAGIQGNETLTLRSKKRNGVQQTFSEKTEKHSSVGKYKKLIPDEPEGPSTKEYTERGFLHYVARKHVEIINKTKKKN